MSGFAERLAQSLVRAGVRALFGVPGSGASYQVIAELLEQGVPYHGTSDEAAAAIMAGAFGRQSGTIGCSVSIKGPGLANMLPGIVSNHFEQLPTLSIAEAVGPLTPAGRVHKRLDQKSLLSSLLKAYATPGDPAQTVSQLVRHAVQEIPGPVHLDLVDGDAPSFVEYAPTGDGDAPTGGAWTDVLKLVEHSSRPLLIVGALGRRHRWGDRLAHLRVPILTTLSAKGIVDERLPHAAGVFTGDGKALSSEHQLLPEADLVVGLGLRNFEVLNPAAISGPLVMVDCVSSDGSAGFGPAAAYTTATAAHFEELLGCVGSRQWGLDVIASGRAALRQRLFEHPWLPAALFTSLEEMLPDAAFVADTGLFCTIAEHLWRASDPNGFLCSANGRYMGTSVPMAIGAALAHPRRPVICAMGDGGVRMHFAELKLALEHKLPILFLFLSDGGYGSIAAAMPPARRRPEVLSMGRPSWFEAALALGCPAEHVVDVPALHAAVQRWRAGEGPRFVEARFDPEAYVTMTDGLR